MTQPSSVPGPPALAGHRSAAVQRATFKTPAVWLAAVLPGMWSFPGGRQQWSPQVHFKGIVVKMPSKINKDRLSVYLLWCCALSDARSE